MSDSGAMHLHEAGAESERSPEAGDPRRVVQAKRNHGAKLSTDSIRARDGRGRRRTAREEQEASAHQ